MIRKIIDYIKQIFLEDESEWEEFMGRFQDIRG